MALLLFLVVLSLLVIFHECGHYFAARFFGCDVEEFGFGFPPRAWGKKIGKTLWSVNWIPLGGFVRIKGEQGDIEEGEGEREERASGVTEGKKGEAARLSTSFFDKPLWQKAIILVAGVTMNIILAVLLFWIAYMAGFPMAIQGNERGEVRNRALTVEQVMADSPAAMAGIEAGNAIVSVNGERVLNYTDFVAAAKVEEAGAIEVVVANGEERTLMLEKTALGNGKFGIGIGLIETGTVSYGVWGAFVEALRTTWVVMAGTFGAFVDLIAGIFSGKGVGEVSGPVGIAVITGQVAKLGFVHLLQFAAMLSVNLAVLNIIPFPALDGGRLLFVGITAVRGRAVAAKWENAAHAIGFFLLMLLVVVVTFKDIARLIA